MRCICVMGPSGAGKTALADGLARLEGEPSREALGDGLELLRFRWHGEDWAAIDVPGAVEALPDLRRALMAADAAVIVVPPDPEAAVLAAPHLLAAEESHTPAIVFVNRMDEATARMRDVVEALQDYAAHAVVLRQVPIRGEDGAVTGAVDLVSERAWRWRDGGPSALIEIPAAVLDREHEAREALLEELSEFDDALLEALVEERAPALGPLYDICARALAEGRAIPALFGAATHRSGLTRLAKALRHETPGPEALAARLAAADPAAAGPPLAVAFRTDHRRHVGKVTFLRALAEGVAPGARLGGGTLGGLLAGAEAPAPGAIAAAAKSEHLAPGRALSAEGALAAPHWSLSPAPTTRRVLLPAEERDEAKLAAALARLAESMPGLSVAKEPGTGRPLVGVQGPVHLKRLLAALSEVFGVAAEDRAPRESALETVARPVERTHRHRKQTGGAGQFAEVRVALRPNPRGTGVTFSEEVKGGSVPRQFHGAVEAGARDATARGPLGAPVTDVHVTLLDGKHHAVDSSDFAFRTAARIAVEEALAEAAPVRLSPVFRVEIHAPEVHAGGLSPLVASLRGQVTGFERDPTAKGWDLVHALMPEAALGRLAQSLRAETQGVGWFRAEFDHHEEVHGRAAEREAAAGG